MTNLIEFELDLMLWQPTKQSAIDGVPTINAPNTKDTWAGENNQRITKHKIKYKRKLCMGWLG